MTCQDMQKQMMDFVEGRMDSAVEKTARDHIAQCSACRSEAEQLQAALQAMDRLPQEEPSPALRERFQAMLDNETTRKNESPVRSKWTLTEWLNRWWPKQPAIQFAFSAACLIIGLVAGLGVTSGIRENGELAAMRQEVGQMRQMVSLALMDQSSSSQRLRGVSFSTHVEKPDASLITGLIDKLNSDPNVNVRLAVVDALYLFVDQPGVREALVASLSRQTSPLIQIGLIDLLVRVKEARALQAMRQLITDQTTDQSVRQHASQRIEELI